MSDTHEHELVLTSDEQRKRGWHLAWRCKVKACRTRGNSTTPDRETAINLFRLLAQRHQEIGSRADDGEEAVRR